MVLPAPVESVKRSSPIEARGFGRMWMEVNPQGVSQSCMKGQQNIIQTNYHGRATALEPDDSSVLPKREALATLKFKNRDASAVPVEK
ncbi:hypothetical protein ACJ73_09933 [Blastomyces percursus]|uniref:Uncharacterized protein n=1 Tax=Blastomyces percursus TaxID=1658174 RepID=A0A1J9Q4M1_9EURO|nr:hypothetical protein ACJ73_09933 [Blastomyces percursus]